MLISTTIKDSLIEIGVINPIDEATPQDLSFGLRTLNRIIDSYNTQNLTITYLQDIALPKPTQWANSVTIGNGKDIDYPAPIEVQSAFFRQGTTDYKLRAMTLNEWSSLSYKFDTSVPSKYYAQYTDGNNLEIKFDNIPQSDLILHLLAKMPYAGVNGEGNEFIYTDDINWTFGFEKMLMLRLAIELCDSYALEPSRALIAKSLEAENNVKSKNFQPLSLNTRFARTRRYGRRRSR